MTKRDLIIVGIGGQGREVLQIARDQDEADGCWNVIGFVDDGEDLPSDVHGFPVLGQIAYIVRYPSAAVCVAIGSSKSRRLAARLISEQSPNGFATLRHPLAWVGAHTEIGVGSVLFPGARVSTGVTMGHHCIVNTNASVSHDCTVRDFVTIAPGVIVSGHSTLEEGCEVGAGAALVPFARVGEWAIVGAGATVVDSIPPRTTAVGTPARPISQVSNISSKL